MKKLILLALIVFLSSCDSKFDGLQDGIFQGYFQDSKNFIYSIKLTFDANKAYLYYRPEEDTETKSNISFKLYQSDEIILDDFGKLFKKYNFDVKFNLIDAKSYYKVATEESIRFWRKHSNYIKIIKKEDPNNIFGVDVLETSGFIENVRNFDMQKAFTFNRSIVTHKIANYQIRLDDDFALKFIYNYKTVKPNQIVLTTSNESPHLNYNQFVEELQSLTEKYKNLGYSFIDEEMLSLSMFLIDIEERFTKSNYYYNMSNGKRNEFELKNLEYTFRK